MTEAIVVLHYNKIKLTETCIDSIIASGYPSNRIYCFDNGSKPEVYASLLRRYPHCRHRRIEKNMGYSGGFNRALKFAFEDGKDAALFCTNDTIVYPDALETCSIAARETGAGIVAPCIHYMSTGTDIDSIGGWFDPETCNLNHYHERNLPLLLTPNKDYIPGTALWINHKTFNELEGTDESFHMYWEDVDMCFRAHQKNIKLARCYEAKLCHGVGMTCRKKPLYTTYYFHRNRIRFCLKYLKGGQLQQAIEQLTNDVSKMINNWTEKDDHKRLNYGKLLMEEIKGLQISHWILEDHDE